ncbi:MAG: hypothetical protein QW303_05650 [Nitrososphaerota archaeon]
MTKNYGKKGRYNKKSEDERENSNKEDDIETEQFILSDKTRGYLRRKIIEWLDLDDKLKELNAKVRKYKETKKQQEEIIIKMLIKLGMEDNKIDVHDENNNIRSRVYRYKSITKGAIKEDIIRDALMEIMRDEKMVDQLVKKIESKRPINERYYLKRTKGSNS